MRPCYPFSAVVGLDDLRLALLLNAVSPAIGGVLVRGEKGTAKSTVVRALASLLPTLDVVDGCRFNCDPQHPYAECPDGPHDGRAAKRRARLVELPVGATEDRLVGSLDLEAALTKGQATYDPGLLAAAHRGVLYVDEVNLLHDHLVDLLLDAAAMGQAFVERDGVSVRHAASFLLVGTMNPEEGELRPQLLDRFGLAVMVRAPRDPAPRVEVIRRRLAYEADPEHFAQRWAAADADLATRIEHSRQRLSKVELPDAELIRIAHVCAAFDVDGMRADIVVARTATALAAWNDRAVVTAEDIRDAARLALPHRKRRDPMDSHSSELDEQTLQDALESEPPDDDDPSGPGGGGGTRTDPAGEPQRARLFSVPGVGTGASGRRSEAQNRTGRVVGARTPRGKLVRIHLPATVRAASRYQIKRGRKDRLLLRSQDLREPVRRGRESNLVLFCVDASGSMAARRRMTAVKTAVLSLLVDAYQKRDKVGLITFRGDGANLALAPTNSVETGAARLKDLPTGGRTPLAGGLRLAEQTIRAQRQRDPQRRALLVVVTDGRATAGAAPVQEAMLAAQRLSRDTGRVAGRMACVVVDCESGPVRLGLARELAATMGAEHVALEEVTATELARVARRVA
ncbi:MAG TPA: VWA domain-containing protein [Candidatus Limnocylindrales bacterium]|nr:VWA domain-containing protein [Candidatus Limnocylindrales bacterium]